MNEGPAGGRSVAIDIDDDALVPIVQAQLPDCVCAKRGKKGQTPFARTPEEQPIKSAVVRGAEPFGNIDILAKGKQTVIPGSIHPETKEPYDWVGQSLLETDPTTLPIFDDRQSRQHDAKPVLC